MGFTHPFLMHHILLSSLRAHKAKDANGVFQRVDKLVCLHAGRGRESEMKFFSLCAELYKGTASRGWKKHKIGDISPIFTI